MIPSTNIIHKVRAELRITCEQYVIADTINQLHLRRKPSSVSAVALELGMNEWEVDMHRKYLVAWDLIMAARPDVTDDDNYKATKKWTSMFFDDTWFDNPLPRNVTIPPPGYVPGFWQVYCSYRPGSDKGKTLAFYQQVIKKVDREELMIATKAYLQSVADRGESQFIMHAQRFLKPSAEHWVAWLPKKDEPMVNTFAGFGNQQPVKDMSGMV